MKHIFKKLHKGGSHEANRSNEASAAASTSGVSNHRHDSSDNGSSHTPAIPSSLPSPEASSANGTSTGGAVVSTSGTTRSDYFSSEEEFQMQLAIAISVSSSNSDLRDDQEREQIRAATLLSLGGNRIDALRGVHGSAEALSKQYWAYNVLDYEEKVVDGFYDVFKISAGLGDQDEMPSLADLEANIGKSDFEVVMVNQTIDSSLEELMQIAHCMTLDCSLSDVGVLVQRLAELVTEHMGGPVIDANVTMAKWVEKRLELRASLNTSVFPIGSLSIGLSRHRALLFKVLADAAGIPCRLVKGSHYTGVDDDAVNIIKLHNERECLVDLMAAPGTLIPSDVLSLKDMTYKPYHPEGSSIQSFSLLNGAAVSQSKPKSLHGGLGGGSQQSAASNNFLVNVNSHSEKMEMSSNATRYHGADSSGVSNRDVIFDHPDPSVAATNLYGHKGNIHLSANGSVENQNKVPYDDCDADHSKSLFADLNPFQMKTSNKIDMLNKVGTLSKNNNITSHRLSTPLAWKNHHACNDVPLNKDKEIFGRMMPSNLHQLKDHNLPSLATNITLESGYTNAFNKSNHLKLTATEEHMDGSYVGRADFAPEVGRCCTSVHEENMGCNNDGYKEDDGFLDTKIEETRDDGNITSIGQNTTAYDQYGVANLENTGIGGLRSSDLTSTSNVDHMFDDVGDCEIPWEDFVIGERIGLGSYGEVYRADWNGTEVAVKKFLDQDFSGAALAEFKREVRIMQRLRHPNVVLFMGAVTRPPNLSIVTEFLPRGSLYRILHRPQSQISEKRRIRMAIDVAKGMNCLHSSIPTIVHRDLKSPNLLVDNNWNVKVCDFGLSRLKHNTFLSSKSTAGTPEWMAPEVLRNEPSNEKCDVYSFGVILWELATQKLPWSGMNPMQVVGAVGFQNRRLEIPKDVDPLVSHIISECWQMDPNKRPSFAQLTVSLKPLQYLVIPSHIGEPSSAPVPPIPVSLTPL